jgi:hypothetical protein
VIARLLGVLEEPFHYRLMERHVERLGEVLADLFAGPGTRVLLPTIGERGQPLRMNWNVKPTILLAKCCRQRKLDGLAAAVITGRLIGSIGAVWTYTATRCGIMQTLACRINQLRQGGHPPLHDVSRLRS